MIIGNMKNVIFYLLFIMLLVSCGDGHHLDQISTIVPSAPNPPASIVRLWAPFLGSDASGEAGSSDSGFLSNIDLTQGNSGLIDFETLTAGPLGAVSVVDTVNGIQVTIDHLDGFNDGTEISPLFDTGTQRNLNVDDPVAQSGASGSSIGLETSGGGTTTFNTFVFSFDQPIAHFGIDTYDLESDASFELGYLRFFNASKVMIQEIALDYIAEGFVGEIGSDEIHFVGATAPSADISFVTLSVGDQNGGSLSDQLAIDNVVFGTAPSNPEP